MNELFLFWRLKICCQNGFRRKKSTVRAIYQALTKILSSIDSGKKTVALYLNLSRAFDSVDHGALVLKLETYGIRGIANKIIASYLSDRGQAVAVKDKNGDLITSEFGCVKRGVPQGLILGPLLYILYTNELPNIIPNTTQFADDTSVVLSLESGDDEAEKISDTLSVMETWFSANNLLLNIDKTQIIKFSYQTNFISKKYANNNKFLETLPSAKFLGIQVDHRLDWKIHTDLLAGKIAGYCYALKVLSTEVNPETAIMAYHAFVHSQLKYGIIFWARGLEANRIFQLQKRCIRNIFNLKSVETCKPKFVESGILTFISAYIYEGVIFIKENPNLFNSFSRNHSHETRHKEDLNTIKCNFTFIQKNVQSSIIRIYNKIPSEIRNQNVRNLKRYLRGLLVSRAYYTLEEFFGDRLL